MLRVLGDNFLLVEGANRVKKHQKPNPMKGTTGGIVDKEMPHPRFQRGVVQSDHAESRPRRHQALDDGRRVRIFKSNGEMLDA